MKYNSIGEYFYRLSNRCLVLVLFPVVVVLIAYSANRYFLEGLPWIKADGIVLGQLLGFEMGVLGLLATIQHWMVADKLKKLISEPSLGKRISGYVPVVVIRFRALSMMILAIGLIVFLTGELLLLSTLLICAFLLFVYWPFPKRMSKDLKLNQSEADILKNSSLGV